MIRTRTLVALCLTLLLAPHVVRAQSVAPVADRGAQSQTVTVDQRWSAWLGCWKPSGRSGATVDLQLCIIPSSDGTGVTRITYAGDREVLNETIVPNGVPQSASETNCTGSRSSQWARSGSRLFLSSTLTCVNQSDVTTTGLSALLGADQWLDVQVVKSGRGTEQTRVQRFWRSSDAPPASVGTIMKALPPSRAILPRVSVDDVIEASAAVPPSAVEAWLSEGAVRVPVKRRELVQLSDARVSRPVIDLMVALAYPKKFEVRRESGGGSASGFGMFTDFYPGQWGFLGSEYGLGYGAYGVPYFFGANGFDQPGGTYFVPGSVTSPSQESTTHGQVVNGQGYTRVQVREPYRGTATTSNGSAQSSSSAGADSGSSDRGSSSSSASSGVSSSGYSSDGGSSTGLTAVPR